MKDSGATVDDKVAQFVAGKPLYEVWPPRFRRQGRWGEERFPKLNRRLRLLTRAAPRIIMTPAIAGDMVRALAHREIDMAKCMAITAAQTPAPQQMVVSRKYGFYWLSTPKVASRSIIAALLGADPDAEIISTDRIFDAYKRYPELTSYYSFAFVRHPFDRAGSFHAQLQRHWDHYEGEVRVMMEEFRSRTFNRYFGLEEATSIDDYCQWLNSPYGSDALADHHFRSQHLVIRDKRGRLPDFIGRFENIQADLDCITTRVGMPGLKLPVLNTASGWTTTPEAWRASRPKMAAQLTGRNKALLQTRYADDFNLFGYLP